MGCDIHIVLEEKTEHGWVGVLASDAPKFTTEVGRGWTLLTGRNYRFFGLLAGVRTDGPEPLGLPDDASDLTIHMLDDDSNLHSHTHTSLREFMRMRMVADTPHDEPPEAALVRAKLRNEDIDGKLLNKYFDWWGDDDLDKYRVCIAFDN